MRYFLAGLLWIGMGGWAWGQLLQQDFSSSTVVADYVSATPNNGQWNAISTSGSGTVISINTLGSNKLRYARTGNAGSYSRTTDFSPTPATLFYRFDVTVSGNSSTQTSAAIWQVGSGFGTANSAEPNLSTHSRIGLNWTATPGEFSIRDLGSGTNTANYSGTQTITWVINNSGSSITYLAPNGTCESLGDDKFDLWIGSTKEFDERNATTGTQTLTDLKFVFASGIGTIDIDNILIDPIPNIPTANAATSITSNSFTANWTTVLGVTGYRLDVATDDLFTSMVSGYDNLQINGQSVSNYTVTGLSAGTTYYYRIRAESAYWVSTITSCNSNSINLTTTSSNSNSSDIIRNTSFIEPQNIDYASYQENDLSNASLEVARFDIRDGGGSTDEDLYGTSLTAITLSVTNWANLRRLAIYDGTTEIAETAVNSETVTFSGLSGLTAPDNGSKSFTLRASFQSTVTDNQQFQFTVTSATADPSGSTFAASNAGGAQSSTSGDRNRIEVTATKLRFIQQPTNVVSGAVMSPAVTVEAADANNNRDLDYTSNISITSTGTLTGSPVTSAPTAGLAAFNSLVHTGNGNSLTLNASSGSLTAASSNTFNVLPNSNSDILASPDFVYPVNISYHVYQEGVNIQLGETSIEVFEMQLRDGGSAPDPDAMGTTLTAITLTATNHAFLRRAALYNGDTELSEIAVTGSSLAFTGFSVTAPDNQSINLTLRVSFTTSVTDNQQFQFTVTSATADPSGSTFAASNAGGAQSSTSGDDNRIEVTATQLRILNLPVFASIVTGFSATVEAYDNNEILDLDAAVPVTLLLYTGSGVLTSSAGLTQNLSNGSYTWNNLQYNRPDSNVSLRTENNSGLINDTSSYFTVVIFRETMGSVSSTTTITVHENNNGFDMIPLTYSGTADIRNTAPSTGYAYASGNANTFITNSIGTYLLISGINTTDYTNLRLSFGIFKSTMTSNGSELLVEVSSDGNNYTQLSFPALPTGTGTTNWYYRTATGSIPSASNLRIRFRQNGTSPQFRIDDVLLTGEPYPAGNSDLIANGQESLGLPYISYQSATINSTSDGLRVWSFTIRDGGAGGDADALPTILTSLTMSKGTQNSVTSWAGTIRQAALFDGSTKIASVDVTGESFTFNGLSGSSVTAPDNGTKIIDLYLTFESTVTDNQQFQFKITNASADPSGSNFIYMPQGFDSSSVSGNRNRIIVTANRLIFSQSPTVAYVGTEFSATVMAADPLGNRDIDITTSVTLSKYAGSGNLSSSGGLTQNLVAGMYQWTDLIWDLAENNVQIQTANTAGLTNATSNAFNVLAFATYVWNQTGSASFTVPGNWTPARNTPVNTDRLVFNNGATVTVTNVPAQTIGQLWVNNNTIVTLQASGAGTLTINGLGGNDLVVAAGSQLNISGTNALTLFLQSGATGSIDGSMTFSEGLHRLNAQSANAVFFRSGSFFTQAVGCTGNVFTNAGTANVIVFQSGASFVSQAGANPFGLSTPNSKVIFQSGSNYIHQQTSVPSFSGRTYANFILAHSSFNQSATGSSLCQFDSLIIRQGTLNLNLTGGIHLRGSINVWDGATLTFSPAINTTLTFNGTGFQKIYGIGTLTFGSNLDIAVNKSDTLFLNRNVTVNKNLSLLNGKIQVVSGNTLTFSTSGSSSGGNNNCFITGQVAKIFPVSGGSQNFQFRTGSRTDMQPVTVTLATVSGSPVTITSEQINQDPYTTVSANVNTSTIDNISAVRYWRITQSGGSFTNAQITLVYVSTPGNSDSVQVGSELRIAQLDGSNTWQLIGGSGSTNWAGTITSNAFNNFYSGYFTFADPVGGADITLPVQLAYFRTRLDPSTGDITLRWRTESETSNAYFLVQRRMPESEYKTLAQIPAQGTKTSATDYAYTDEHPPQADTLVYRLADVAYNGIITFHEPQILIRHLPARFDLLPNYPNPFNPTTSIVYHLPEAADVSVTIYNALGQRIKTLINRKDHPAGIYRLQWNGQNDMGNGIASGLYIVRFKANRFSKSRKILLLK